MTFRAHEGDPCKWCGKANPLPNTACPLRPMPEPARREYAADDADTIFRRIGELRAEAEAARNRKEPVQLAPAPQQDHGDCCG